MRSERAVIAEHEAAIGCGIGRPHAGDRDRRLRRAAPRVEQLGDGVGAQQRGVAEQHDNVGDVAPGEAIRRARSAPRAPRRRCRAAGIGRRSAPARPHRATASMSRPSTTMVAAGSSGSQRVDDMADHRLPGDLVQHLGARGFEAGALAGGEDDGGEAGSAHDTARPKVHGERNAIIEAKVARRPPPCQHTDCCGI